MKEEEEEYFDKAIDLDVPKIRNTADAEYFSKAEPEVEQLSPVIPK